MQLHPRLHARRSAAYDARSGAFSARLVEWPCAPRRAITGALPRARRTLRVASTLWVLASVGACSFGWESLDPRLDPSPADATGEGRDTGQGGGVDAGPGDSQPDAETADATGERDGNAADAPPGRCGDGVLQAPEECDVGDTTSTFCVGCVVHCTNPNTVAYSDVVKDPTTHNCFLRTFNLGTWTAGASQCQKSHFATRLTASELATVTAAFPANETLWVAARSVDATPTAFTWQGGGRVSSDLWATTEPNSGSGQCVAASGGGLVVRGCATGFNLVCEFP